MEKKTEKIKYTYEDFVRKVEEKEFEILDGEYIDCASRFLVKSKEGYLCNVKAYSLITNRETRFFHPKNEHALYNIDLYLKNNNIQYKLLSKEYKEATDELEFECEEHGTFKRTFKIIRKGRYCPMCSKFRRKTNEEINKKLKCIGWEWIDGEYISAFSKLILENKDGYRSNLTVASLFQNVKPIIFGDTNPFTIFNIQRYLEKNNLNIKIKSNDYINSRAEMKFECGIHGTFYMSWTNFGRNGNECPKCKGSYIYSIEEVKEMLSNINPNIEILYEIKDTGRKRGFMCKCLIDGNEWVSSYTDLIKRQHGCRFCAYRANSGENHYYYNHNKSEEERITRREYTEYYKWREDVYRRDNYTCQCCGYDKGGKLNAHHLNGYSWDIEHRTDINNGITLCRDCHEGFHRIYGYNNNTKEQFEEWIKNNHKKDLETALM